MNLGLTDEEPRALLNLLMDAIEDDRFPLSPRVQLYGVILMKLGEQGVAPELAEKLRRYASPPPAPLPVPKPYASATYAPPTKGRYRKRR
jgi:hypothetical protein